MSASDSNADNTDKDRSMSLLEISSSLPSKPLISRLIDIQSYKIDQKKSLGFIENLDCLYFCPPKRSRDDEQMGPTVLRRRKINVLEDQDFAALSYTWNPSPKFESETPSGGYRVQQRGSYEEVLSPVRNSVFDRVQQYMHYAGTKNLWIDQHCIEQTPGPEKEMGMQAMDLVYSKSKYPVTLLARPIELSTELSLLVRILNGTLVRKHKQSGDFEISRNISPREALQAVELLKAITDDLWWKRGWTFQENYRALWKMRLLMPHAPHLEDQKPHKLLGRLHGQLCIESWKFHEEATKLCLAYEKQQPVSRSLCQSVIASAGKYTILLQEQDEYGNTLAPKSMTPRIFADITQRDLGRAFDRLAVAANCCRYSVRLDSTTLMDVEPSVSLSMLALYLLNGEILSNHPEECVDPETARASTVIKFIDLQSYNGFDAPFLKGRLTFNKSCRFVQVQIAKEGIRTKGYLWVIHKYLRAGVFSSTNPPFEPFSENGLPLHVRRRLRELAETLNHHGEKFVANRLDQFLEDDLNVGPQKTFAKTWLDIMAENLVWAMDEGKELGIGHLVDDITPGSASGAIFVLEDVAESDDSDGDVDNCETVESSICSDSDVDDAEWSDMEELECEDQVFVFTSSRPEDSSWEVDFNDIDRYVSMVVDFEDVYKSMPRLFTQQWIHGLYFFEGWSPRDVLFPWPQSLVGL